MSKVQLHGYRREDFAALHALDRECFAPGIAYAEDELRYFLSARDAVVRVAHQDDIIVGFLIAQIYRGRPSFQARIITIDVAQSHRKSGIGTLLRRLSITRVRLEVAATNNSAQSFYAKHKYEQISCIPSYYPTGEDALVMQKQLARKDV